MNRPVLWAALAFAAGIGAIDLSRLPWAWLMLGVAAGAVGYLTPRRLPYRDGFLVALVFFLAGGTWTAIRAPERRSDAFASHVRQHPDAVYTVDATVVQAPVYTPETDYMSVRLRVDDAGIPDTPLRGHALLRWSQPDQALHPGERITVRGRVSPLLGEVNFGIRGVEDYYRVHGYHTTLRARGPMVNRVASPRWSLRYWASRIRQWQARVFARAAPEEVAPFLRAVWLGDRSAVDPEAREAFLATGTAHILAVSGIHVGILYMTLQWLLRGLIRGRKRRSAVILAVIVIFALVTGARTPILRATIMLTLYLWADFLDREPDAPTGLALAAFFFLGYNPALLHDAGFALSFTCLGSLFVFTDALAERFTALPRVIRQNVAATVGVSVLPLPLIAHLFHVVSLIGPLCNLLVIPLLAGLLGLSLLTVTAALLADGAAMLFGHAAYPVVFAIRTVGQWGAAIPGGHLHVTSPSTLAWFAWGAAALGIWVILRETPKQRQVLYLTVAAAAATVVFWRPLYQPATMDFLDVGHGDATFIRTPGGTTVLVDGGNRGEYVDQGARTVVPWLRAQHVSRLDYVVATHPDRDHVGGLLHVLDTVDVGAVLLWPRTSEDPDAKALVRKCEVLDIPMRRTQAGEELDVEGATIRVLHPAASNTYHDVNDRSIVLHVTWPGMNALLTGDIEAPAERALLDRLPDVNLLKAPHHGSYTSSTPAFLDATRPEIAIVSTREKSTRDGMAAAVEARYQSRRIPIYRTDHHGGIRVRPWRGTLQVTTARGARGYSLAARGN